MIAAPLAAAEVADGCAKNLDALGRMSHFNQWIFDTIRPYLGGSIIEVGSGNARFSAMMIQLPQVRRYLGLDIDPSYNHPIEALAKQYPEKEIAFRVVDLEKKPLAPTLSSPFDTLVCLNVLEHLRDDHAALEDFASSLAPGGRLILQVPAFNWLYGSIDAVVGHHRRYSRRVLRDVVSCSGFEIDRCFYFNLIGVAAWIWHAKIRRLKVHPEGDLRFGDALVPLFRGFESLVPIPVGLSLFLVATRRRNS